MQEIKKFVEESIVGIKDRLKELVPHFAGDFAPLFKLVAVWFTQVWQEVERKLQHDIQQMRARFEEAKDTFRAECETEYRRVHDKALERLRVGIRKAIIGHWNHSAQATGTKTALRQHEIELDDQLRAQLVSMAGDEDAAIDVPKRTGGRVFAEMSMVAGAILAVMGIEWLTGYSMWEWASDRNIATGLSMITVLTFTVLTRIVVVNLRHYMAHADAIRAFRRNYSNEHPDGFRVFPFPAGEKMVAFGGLGVLGVTSLLLLVSRIWIVLRGEMDFGALAATVGLLVVAIVYGLGEFVFTRPYRQSQYERLGFLQDELGKIQDGLEGPAESPYKAEAIAAIAEYNQAMDAVEAKIKERASKLEQLRKGLVGLYEAYFEAWDTLRAAYLETVNYLSMLVIREWSIDGVIKIQPMDERVVVAFFTEAAIHSFGDREFMTQVMRFQFVEVFPSGVRIEDFTEVFTTARMEVAPPLVTGHVSIGYALPAAPAGAVDGAVVS